ncbi:MAG: hypothetical protein MJ180_00350 [Candidatus Gastranaerophilales bacterium]|nr:hypothetical protein [Candidatus Gastranaerophilales bacterium]
MEYSVKINNVNFKSVYHAQEIRQAQVQIIREFMQNNEIRRTMWSNYMENQINNQLQCNLTVEKADKILKEETREIKFNPVEQYNNLAEGDKKALSHLVKAGKILNDVFIKQEHERGFEFRETLKRKADSGDIQAQKTLELYNIFNGIQDERKEQTLLFKNIKLNDGRNLFPTDVKADEVIKFLKANPNKIEEILSNNTVIRRTKDGGFEGIPYQIFFKKEYEEASKELLEAAKTSTNEQFNEYLRLQANALISTDPEDSYKADVAWIKLADTPLEFTIARECYEDKFTGQVLEDKELSELIAKQNLSANSKDMIGARVGIVERKSTLDLADYKNHMKAFSKEMPLAETYEQSVDKVDPAKGSKQTLVDVDLVYLGGDSGTSRPGVTLAQNLPNSDKLAAKRGAGNRNVFHRDLRKSFDPELRKKFLESLIDESQRELYSDDADHLFTIGHELTHSLGPMKTAKGLDKKSALGDWGDAVEEAKADLGSVLMCDYFTKVGKYSQKQMDEILLTFAAGLLLNEQPSKAQAHRVRTLAQFNYLKAQGAIEFEVNGRLKINKEKFVPAAKSMLTEIIQLQLDGDANKANEFFNKWFIWCPEEEYASKILKSLKPKIYKKLNYVLADEITK